MKSSRPSELQEIILSDDLWLLDVRHIRAVGHLITEPLAMMMEIHLGLRPKKKYVILAPENVTEHKWFLRYLEEEGFTVQRNPEETELWRKAFWHLGRVIHTSDYAANESYSAEIFKLVRLAMSSSFPFFTLKNDDRNYFINFLNRIGAPLNRWIATLQIRVSSKRAQDHGGVHDFRNTGTQSYDGLADHIYKLGGLLVRVGDVADIHLGDKAIDVPKLLHGRRDCRLDLAAVGHSKLFIGCASGMGSAALAFGVPTAFVNMVPSAAGFTPLDVCLYKTVRDVRSNSITTVDRLLASQLAYANFYRAIPDWPKFVNFIPNSPKQVIGCVDETLNLTEPLEKRSAAKLCDVRKFLSPGAYSYHTAAKLSNYNNW
jgi:putative glycosyltransferase (TIGR04372 family)